MAGLGVAAEGDGAMNARPSSFPDEAEYCALCRKALHEWQRLRPVMLFDGEGWATSQVCAICELQISASIRRTFERSRREALESSRV